MKTKNGMRFGITFDTLEMPGKIVATTVELGKWVMTEKDTINVALCGHPLYPALEQYVRSNPSRPPKNSVPIALCLAILTAKEKANGN